MSPSPIRTVGRYELLEVIGRGGAAVMYLAVQGDLRREVALKELAPAVGAADPSFALRFSQESRVAGSLSHPNVVTVFEFLVEDGVPYIAMEYLPRGSLRPYVGALSLVQVVGVLEGVLAGLAHGESHAVVHRDLKPENLLVTADGRVKIADFGVARAYADAVRAPVVTAVGTMIGTPAYMAPEQALGGAVGPAADLYSLGVVAWELLAGRVPFEDKDTPVAVLYQHVHEAIPPVRSVAPDVDPRIEAWLERMLAKDPADRFASAEAAWEALEDVVLDLLGPRWRRDARLPAADADAAGRPLTPAVFAPTLGSVPAAGGRATVLRPARRHDHEVEEIAPERPRGMLRRALATVALLAAVGAAVLAGVLLSSGGSDHKPARHPKPARPLSDWTVMGSEDPGYAGGGTKVDTTVAEYTAADADRLVAVDPLQLTSNGYRRAVVETLIPRTATEISGESSVVELGSPAAARRLDVLHIPPRAFQPRHLVIKGFPAPAVPGMHGIEVTSHTGGTTLTSAEVIFAEGSCELTISNSAAGSNITAPVEQAAVAVYRRTHGSCP
jgi:hypothetical protein